MPCSHPLASLKPETAEQDKGQVTIRFACTDCLARITKAFMVATPDPLPHVEKEIADLLTLPESGMPTKPAKVRRGENSPWRQYQANTR